LAGLLGLLKIERWPNGKKTPAGSIFILGYDATMLPHPLIRAVRRGAPDTRALVAVMNDDAVGFNLMAGFFLPLSGWQLPQLGTGILPPQAGVLIGNSTEKRCF